MSTSKAFLRQVKSGSFQILKVMATHNLQLRIKILLPFDNNLENVVASISNNTHITIKFIEPLSRVSILVIDRKYMLVAETKDDTALEISDPIGFITYSSSIPSVLSYVAIHETIWNQTKIYQQLSCL